MTRPTLRGAVRRATMALGSRGLVPALRSRGTRAARSVGTAEAAIPVVMCMWRRPGRLPAIIEMLAGQEFDGTIRLELWNNARANHRELARAIRDADLGGKVTGIRLTTSPVNVGGIGRFYLLKKLRRAGLSGPAILLDDDQDVTPGFVADLMRRYTPRSLHGVWAWRRAKTYWDRVEAQDGEPANYVGTGGCILDASIVDDRAFFDELPPRYLFLEDIWMSHVAGTRGWDLRKVDTPFAFVQEDLNQHHGLTSLKDEFVIALDQRD